MADTRRKPVPGGYVVSDELYRLCVSSVSGARAKRAVEALSLFHRIQASSGYKDAAELIASELKTAGLDEVELHEFPSDGRRKYFQHVAPAAWEGRRAVLRIKKPFERDVAKFPDVTCALCPGSQSANVRGPLVFIKGGAVPEDYKGKNVRGKFVLTSARARDVQREAVMHRGALGSIHYPPDLDDPDKVPYHGLFPEGAQIKGFTFSFAVSRRTAEDLRGLLDAGKKVVLEANVDARVMPGRLAVLRASVRGRSSKAGEIGIISHLCHPRPGANDNASGSAASLEIARTLAGLVSSGKIKRPKRTISFLYVPEFYGTFAYIHHFPEYAENLRFLLNLDMVGEDQNRCNSTLLVTSEPHSTPGVLSDIVADLLGRIRDDGVFSHDGTRNVFRFRRIPFIGGSDHQVLAHRAFGVPSTALINWPDTFYHTSHDVPEHTDASMLKRVAAAGLAAAVFLADAGEADALRLIAHAAATGRARFSTALAERKAALASLAASGYKAEAARAFIRMRRELDAVRNAGAKGLDGIRSVADGKFTSKMLSEAAVDWDVFARTEIELFEWYGWRLAEKYKLPAVSRVRPDKEDARMEAIVPKQRHKGPLNTAHFRDILGGKKWEYYRVRMKGFTGASNHVWEALNFADGKRDLLEIFHRVSAEYGNVDKAFILRLFEDLEKTGLIRFVKRKQG
jgi:hypothetical protein